MSETILWKCPGCGKIEYAIIIREEIRMYHHNGNKLYHKELVRIKDERYYCPKCKGPIEVE